jgi:hypothetical protein
MTTGQPIKVPSDRNKYNNEFMENLRLQIKLNDQNLQANRLFLTTGQMPASTQMADTRSTTEKLADIEGLKKSIVADLSPVAETSFAYAIIEGVMNSPLNVDNSLFRYLAQNASQLAQQLSKKYKFGIAGDANDVQILVEFLNDAYSKTKNTFQSIKGYMNSSTNLRATNTNMQDQIIQELKFFLQRLSQLEIEMTKKYGNLAPFLNEEIIEARGIISGILYSLPNQQQMNQILSDISTGSYNQPFNDPNLAQETPIAQYDNDIIKLVIDMLDKLPNIESIRTLLNTLEKGIKTESYNIIRASLRGIEELFNDWIIRDGVRNTPFQNALQRFRATFLREANEEIEENARVNRISTIRQIEFQNQQHQQDIKAQRVYVINPGSDPVKVIGGPFENDPGEVSSYGSVFGPRRSRTVEGQSSYTLESQPGSQQSERSYNLPIAQSESGSPYGSIGGYQTNSQPGSSWYQGSQGSQQSEKSYNLPFTQSEIGSESGSQGEEFSFSDQYPQIYPDDPNAGYSYLGENPMANPKFGDVSQRSPSTIRNPQVSYNAMKKSLQQMYRKPEAYEILKREYPSETLQDTEFDDMRKSSSKSPSKRAPSLPSKSNNQEYIDLMLHHHTELDKLVGQQGITQEDVRNIKTGVSSIASEGAVRGYDIEEVNKIILKMAEDYLENRPRGNGIYKKIIKKGRGISSDYRDFGINKINHKKLDDGILTVRRMSNTNIPDMPSKRISRKLQKIIKHISGGGIPDYNDLNNLEDGEKDYLHKLISKSNLTDRLSVPAPSKEQEEKDFHQFEVMKGEIMSGNDSKELVKKFKVLILKLSKQNVLPKNEVQELLEDLLSLGY